MRRKESLQFEKQSPGFYVAHVDDGRYTISKNSIAMYDIEFVEQRPADPPLRPRRTFRYHRVAGAKTVENAEKAAVRHYRRRLDKAESQAAKSNPT